MALFIYPTNYSVSVDPLALKTPQTDRFSTHSCKLATTVHRLSEFFSEPGHLFLRLTGRIITPLPGENKGHCLRAIVIRICSFVLAVLIAPLALICSLFIAIPLRCIDHRFRPAISYMNHSARVPSQVKTEKNLVLTKESPLHIRTHNVGFVSSSMSIVGDLRPPKTRAHELVESISLDPLKPDIIFFQETFNEKAARVLCEGIKSHYPFIIHNVAPQLTGFNSGALVASRFPIEKIDFHRFKEMIGPERASPRGILTTRIKSPKGPLLIYNVHTQAMIGEDNAKSRRAQLIQISELMEEDLKKEPNALQVLVGDLNTSRVTIWGEDNLTPSGQAEEAVLELVGKRFDDPYLKDHNGLTGERTFGKCVYLASDNERMQLNLREPSGSWYHGPLAKSYLLKAKMANDRRQYKRPFPTEILGKPGEKSTWGTPSWRNRQLANTARLDYVLLPKGSTLHADVEIRRMVVGKNAQSAPSDHLPVDARIWV